MEAANLTDRSSGNTTVYAVDVIQCFNAGIIGVTIGNKIKFPLSFAVNLIVVWGLAIITDQMINRIPLIKRPKEQ